MKIPKSVAPLILGVLVGALVAASGCDDSDPVAVLTDTELTTQLETAINDEYRAEAIYARVLVDFGDVLPFYNIVESEERHSAALARLFASRGLPVPASAWDVDNVPVFSSVRAACQAGVTAELANIELYDQWLDQTLPPDVLQVFTSNRRASIERHLPAFQQCS